MFDFPRQNQPEKEIPQVIGQDKQPQPHGALTVSRVNAWLAAAGHQDGPVKFRWAEETSLPTAAAAIVFLIVLLRTAWLGEDAFITFRTVDNFVNGYGLTWNTTERVQGFTNPLWMFLVSFFYFFSHEIFYTALLISVGISLLAVVLL